ncbi:MAG: acyltransferase, partial [Deferribacteraceae bacterium]|nr:acyltransferase [Deferribacteraceae bacterium]
MKVLIKPPHSANTMGDYRPDIEGLRALAVLSVVLFHAGFASFQAGFIGVDIFFVISGFLITSGIYKDIKADRFSVFSFFNRRFWRIQPLLLVLMLATAIFWSLWATPADLASFTHSLKSLSLFISNQYFASLDFGYFADDTSIMPLLHTWSLSIEWQWYFLLPFLLLLIIKGFSMKALPWMLLAGLLLLTYLSIKPSNMPEHLRYYAFNMRCFALLAG